ncbi:MAG: hypothetical protein Q4E61_02855 [Alphaproteobacteria bacterium]|nr:hypothetical protein [Alphaproteobacteria bacterium]
MEDIKEELTPQQYFDAVKERKHNITDDELSKVYDNCLELLNKYKITGQKKGMRKLLFHLECIEKEREIVKMGINTFIYRDDIEEYIDNIVKDTVKIIELENYEREIPDEIVDVIGQVKDKFDQLYVVFTDYTGKVERQIEKERRDKDPILFGTFQNQLNKTVIDRFYYLGDWEDEYCDLTLDKMVNETEKAGKRNIVKSISTPKDIEELKEQLNQLEKKNDFYIIAENKDNKKTKKSFFTNIKTFIGGKHEK